MLGSDAATMRPLASRTDVTDRPAGLVVIEVRFDAVYAVRHDAPLITVVSVKAVRENGFDGSASVAAEVCAMLSARPDGRRSDAALESGAAEPNRGSGEELLATVVPSGS